MTARELSVGQHRLSYFDEGAGQPVVLLHSGGFSARQWRRLRDALGTTHRVLTPDLLGYGSSGAWPDGVPFHFHSDVAAIVALLATLEEPAHLVGHSYGGLLALHTALVCPAHSIAVYEPVTFGVLDPVADREALSELARVRLSYTPDASGVDELWFTQFVDWWNGPGAWAAMSSEARAGFRSVGWKLSSEVRSLVHDRTDLLRFATITAPTLLLGGERTPVTEQRVLERLATGLPHATFRLFAGMGHMGPISHAAVVNDAICAHIRAT